MARRSEAQISKILKEIKKMSHAEGAKHAGVSVATLYKWKDKAKSTKATPTVVVATTTPTAAPAVVAIVKPGHKKIISLVNVIKEKLAKLEKELTC